MSVEEKENLDQKDLFDLKLDEEYDYAEEFCDNSSENELEDKDDMNGNIRCNTPVSNYNDNNNEDTKKE